MIKTTRYLESHLLNWLLVTLIGLVLTSCGGGNGEVGITPTADDQALSEKVVSEFSIGPTWDALKVSSEFLFERNDFLTARLAANTVKVTTVHRTGTGFYLGKHLGHHIIATTAHGLVNVPSCKFSTVLIQFPMAKKVYTCKELIGIWADVDYAMLALKAEPEEDEFFATLNPLKLAPLSGNPLQGTPLMSMGFGSVLNNDNQLTLKEDRYCTNLSPQFARMNNGDERIPRKIPSFAVGCDLSPGDSGSALVDKENGRVVGMVWSIMKPKSPFVKSAAFLEDILSQSEPNVWEDFGYAVPVSSIRRSLQIWANRVEVSLPMRKRRRIVLKILDQ
jgi:hypothetical protein